MDGLLGERLNGEPVVFRGYTDSELLLAVAVSSGFWFPVAAAVGFAAGSASMGLGFAMIAIIGSVAGGATLYQKWKRGRPEHYLQQRVQLWLASAGLVKTRLVRHRGVMGLGRDFR